METDGFKIRLAGQSQHARALMRSLANSVQYLTRISWQMGNQTLWVILAAGASSVKRKLWGNNWVSANSNWQQKKIYFLKYLLIFKADQAKTSFIPAILTEQTLDSAYLSGFHLLKINSCPQGFQVDDSALGR